MLFDDKTIVVSVIIPMYNVEQVIDRCLSSLLVQDIQDVEYLFIDDCSTDDTVLKLTAWIAEQQKEGVYYRLICHDSNQGVAAARNTGLENARGKYIYYVDADDYLEPQALKILYQLAEEQQADIVGCEWFLSFKTNERHMRQCEVATGEELFRKMALGVMRWNLWLFFVKRSLYEDYRIRFIPRMNMGEDMMVMSKLSLLASKISICHQPLYHYVQYNSGSLTKSYQKGFSQIIANIREIDTFVCERGRSDLKDYIHFMKLNSKLPFLISSKTSDYRYWLECFSESNNYIEKNRESSLYTRFIQLAARNKQFWILKIYYWTVIKILYGCIYK